MNKTNKPFLTLGIETSCDDTSIALLQGPNTIKTCKIASQTHFHTQFGGVVPEYASRLHSQTIIPLIKQTLQEQNITNPSKQLDLIAVTSGPGLMGSLLVGVMTAKALSQAWQIPLIGVNHLEGHIYANMIGDHPTEFPFLCLIVSGGHTEIVQAHAPGNYKLLGATKDDAAGECFDKIAKVLGLPYPGGPIIDKLAKEGNPNAYPLTQPLKGATQIAFSFSGLKTSAINQIRKLQQSNQLNLQDFCASFQKTIIDSLIQALQTAVTQTGITTIRLSGGVAANSALRDAVQNHPNWQVTLPPKAFCTDNAAMIAAAGYATHQRGITDNLHLAPDPSANIFTQIVHPQQTTK